MEHRIGRRIIIIGSSNAGKSTLAWRLAKRLGVPHIELDALHWEPGWVEADDDVFSDRVRRAIDSEAWVMEGNYILQQQHVSWPVADTIVWLDLSLPTVLRRCVHRSWRRWRSKEFLYGNNRENVWEHLMLWDTDKSLIAHIVKRHRSRRRAFERYMTDPRWAHLTFIRLRSVAEVDTWFDGICSLSSGTDARADTAATASGVGTSGIADPEPDTIPA